MTDYRIIRLALSSNVAGTATEAFEGIELSDAEIIAKTTVGDAQLGHGGVRYNGIDSMCTDYSGNIYGVSSNRHCVVKIEESGRVSWVAGSQVGTSGDNGTKNGVLACNARFNTPIGIACDKYGTLYIADKMNHQIRTVKGGLVNVLAGSAGLSGLTDGAGEDARFNRPVDVAVDRAGVVWVADSLNYALRKITNDGKVLTVAGDGVAGNSYNVTSDPQTTHRASNTTAMFGAINAVTVDQQGNVYISDPTYYSIKKYTADGKLYRYSGGGNPGRSLGLGGSTEATCSQFTCSYTSVYDLAADASGNVYVIDHMTTGGRLLKLDRDGVPSEVADWNGNSYHGPYAIAVSPAQILFVSNIA